MHSMIHLNEDLLCAVDVLVTGRYAGHDSMIGLAIIPLNHIVEFYNLKEEDRYIRPLDLEIQPNRPENINLEKHRYKAEILHAMTAIDYDQAGDIFLKWFDDLRLKFRKKLQIISYDWPHKEYFLREWLGNRNYEHCFSPLYRDLFVVTNYISDYENFKCQRITFPKNFIFRYICSQLNVEYTRKQDLINNCRGIAECYKRILQK